MKLISLKSGWKTYAVVAAGLALGAAQAVGVHVPGWLDMVLGFLGLGALRHGVQSQTATVIANVLDALTVPQEAVLAPSTVTPALTTDDVARAVATALAAQRGIDQAAANKVQSTIDKADVAAPKDKAALLADLAAGAK